MSVIRVTVFLDFKGEDVVLLAMDTAGLDIFAAAFRAFSEQGSAARLEHYEMTHHFLAQPGGADIELDDHRVVWRLDRAKTLEISECLASLRGGGPGHHYVDISKPTQTLVLSRDEYVA